MSSNLDLAEITASSLGLSVTFLGSAGVLYASWVVRQARRQTGYAPVFEDWLFHAGLPILAWDAAVYMSVKKRKASDAPPAP